MTTRYEIRQVNPKFIDIHIAGIPSSAGCEARVPVREGREHAAREFAAHLVNLLNLDGGAKNEERETGSGERGAGRNSPLATRSPHPAPRTPTPDERWQPC